MKKDREKSKSKLPDWDDGRTVAPMNGDELPPYRRLPGLGRERRNDRNNDPAHNNKPERITVTKKERRAMIRAMFAALLPRLVIVLLSFSLVFCLMYLWLR